MVEDEDVVERFVVLELDVFDVELFDELVVEWMGFVACLLMLRRFWDDDRQGFMHKPKAIIAMKTTIRRITY